MGALRGDSALVLRRRQRKGVASAQDEGSCLGQRFLSMSAEPDAILILSKGGAKPPASKDEDRVGLRAPLRTTP
jgi:hypothetical protein